MRNWIQKFRVAVNGIGYAFADQTSFWIHLPCGLIVIGLGVWLSAKPWQWAAIAMAIGIVLVAEMLNSAIELLVKAVHPAQHPLVGRALDVSAGAVLLAALTATGIGVAAFGPDLFLVAFGHEEIPTTGHQ